MSKLRDDLSPQKQKPKSELKKITEEDTDFLNYEEDNLVRQPKTLVKAKPPKKFRMEIEMPKFREDDKEPLRRAEPSKPLRMPVEEKAVEVPALAKHNEERSSELQKMINMDLQK